MCACVYVCVHVCEVSARGNGKTPRPLSSCRSGHILPKVHSSDSLAIGIRTTLNFPPTGSELQNQQQRLLCAHAHVCVRAVRARVCACARARAPGRVFLFARACVCVCVCVPLTELLAQSVGRLDGRTASRRRVRNAVRQHDRHVRRFRSVGGAAEALRPDRLRSGTSRF